MSANWELAVAEARGNYIVIIGDDDGVLPGAMDRPVEEVERSPMDVYFWPKHVYVWPAPGRGAYVESFARETAAGPLDIGALSRFVLRMGGWRYSLLPSMYHSLVNRRISDCLRDRHGRVYQSTEPDVFMMMAISTFTETAWKVGYSVTAHGRSPKSNGWAFTVDEELAGQLRFLVEYGLPVASDAYPVIPRARELDPRHTASCSRYLC